VLESTMCPNMAVAFLFLVLVQYLQALVRLVRI